MVLLEYLWARAVQFIRDDNAINAGHVSGMFSLVQSVITIIYVNDPYTIPAVIVGAWIGTFLAVWLHKKNPQSNE